MSNEIDSLKSKAEKYYEEEKYEDSIQAYSELLEKNIDNQLSADIENSIGLCEYRLENYEVAASRFKLFFKKLSELSSANTEDKAIALLNAGNALYNSEKYEESVKYYIASKNIYVELNGEVNETVAALYIDIANCFYGLDNYHEAGPFYDRAIEIADQIYDNKDENLIRYCRFAGNNFYEADEDLKALKYYSRVSENICESEYNTADLIEFYDKVTNSANLVDAKPEYEIFYKKLLQFALEFHGENNKNSALSYKKLGKFYDRLGDKKNALEQFTRAFNIFNEISGNIDPATLEVQKWLAAEHYYLEDYKHALFHFENILALSRRNNSANEKTLIVDIANVAYTYKQLDEYKKAEKLFEEVYERSTKVYGLEAAKTSEYRRKLSDLYYQNDQYAKAVKILEEEISVKQKISSVEDINLGELFYLAAKNLSYLPKKAPDAEKNFLKALDIYGKVLEPLDEKTVVTAIRLADLYCFDLKQPASAIELLFPVQRELQSKFEFGNELLQRASVNLAEIYIHVDKFDYSEELCVKIINSSEESDNVSDYYLMRTYRILAEIKVKQGNKQSGLELIYKAYNLSVSEMGEKHWRTKAILQFIGQNFSRDELTKIMGDLNNSSNLENYFSFIRDQFNNPDINKSIRVFISSTFRDMMGERDYLMRNIFPELKKVCKQNGIDFTEVDLRWGVTEEDAKKGKVIQICLHEIDKSRPYFIGILGERYGWIPDKNALANYENITNEYSWIKEAFDNQLSITEMEIQYGVLENPAMKGNAFFYLRDKNATPDNDDFFEKEGSLEYEKLKILKEKIKETKDFPVKEFDNLNTLGQLIYNDLYKLIISNTNSQSELTGLEKQRILQTNFINKRADFYIKQESNIKQLDNFIASDKNKLVLYSEPGMGKSTLLSSWIKNKFKSDLEFPIVFHFAEADKSTNFVLQMLKRITSEISEIFNLNLKFNDSHPNPSSEVIKILSDDRINKKVVIVIDGLEILKYNEFFAPLYWLPDSIPENIKLIISTNDMLLKQQLTNNHFDPIELNPMLVPQRKEFIEKFYSQYGKKLPEKLIKRILKDEISLNPLTLQIILDELRIFGVHEQLEERLNVYLAADGPVQLFERIIRRIEKDYDEDFEGLTKNALALLAITNIGLSENEIISITDSAMLYWSPIQSSLENYLSRTGGKIKINNRWLKQAVINLYLSNENFYRELKYKLLINLEDNNNPELLIGEVDELLFELNEKERLGDFITNFQVFKTMIETGKFEKIMEYRKFLGDSFDLGNRFKEHFNSIDIEKYDKTELTDSMLKISVVLSFDQEKEIALYFIEKAYEIRSDYFGEKHVLTADALIRVADWKHQSALELESEFKLISDEFEQNRKNYKKNDAKQISGKINNLKEKFESRKKECIDHYKMAIEIIESSSYKTGIKIAGAYGALAKIYLEDKNLDEAKIYLEKQREFLTSAMGEDNPALSDVYLTLAQIDIISGDFEEAEAKINKAAELIEKAVGKENLTYIMVKRQLVELYNAWGKDEQALPLLIEVESHLSRSLGVSHPTVLATNFHLASKYFQMKEFRSAEEILVQLIDVAIENNLGSENYASLSIELLGYIYKLTGETEKAEKLKEILE